VKTKYRGESIVIREVNFRFNFYIICNDTFDILNLGRSGSGSTFAAILFPNFTQSLINTLK
jgi:hypothetical protein